MTPSIANVRLAAMVHFGVSAPDMDGDRRRADLVRCRHIAMMAASRLTGLALPEIARGFRRDRNAVRYAIRVVEERLAEDARLAADLDAVVRLASAGRPPLSEIAVDGLLAAVAKLERLRFSGSAPAAISEVIDAARACLPQDARP